MDVRETSECLVVALAAKHMEPGAERPAPRPLAARAGRLSPGRAPGRTRELLVVDSPDSVRPVNSSTTAAAQGDVHDVASLLTPPVARVGGGLSLLSGIITALTSLQTISITNLRGPLAAAPYLLLALGVAAAIAGGKLLGGHGRAAIAAAVLNTLLFFASGAWLVVSLLGGLFSLFALVDPGLAFLAGAVAMASIAPCGRVTAARLDGERAGFGLGI